eukprot:GHVH01006670.1.p1 GENE.GHVH01006670.1~~GHVH01006670.1.p1  ORF type:complete len:457 (+),score=39.32 GHVH01006670.1:119-1489(+)
MSNNENHLSTLICDDIITDKEGCGGTMQYESVDQRSRQDSCLRGVTKFDLAAINDTPYARHDDPFDFSLVNDSNEDTGDSTKSTYTDTESSACSFTMTRTKYDNVDAEYMDMIKLIVLRIHSRRLNTPPDRTRLTAVSHLMPLLQPTGLFKSNDNQSEGNVAERNWSSASEPKLVIELSRFPGCLRKYGARIKTEAFVRMPLEMIIDTPALYLELTPQTSSCRSSRNNQRTSKERGIFSFTPFDQGPVRVHLSRDLPQSKQWVVQLLVHGPNRCIKLESAALTILIQANSQRTDEARLHFDLLLDSMSLWRTLRWNLNNLCFIHTISKHLKFCEDAKNDFSIYVVRLLYENLALTSERERSHRFCTDEISNARAGGCAFTRDRPNYLLLLSDPCHPMGPICSILDWLWNECHMNYPVVSRFRSASDYKTDDNFFKEELRLKASCNIRTSWMSKTLR